MGSRSGDIDPGLALYLSRVEHLSNDELEALFNHQCGLAGLSGGESDMQALLAREAKGDRLASLAVQMFCTDVSKTIGAYAALMGGIDLLVFTGGIGMHSKERYFIVWPPDRAMYPPLVAFRDWLLADTAADR